MRKKITNHEHNSLFSILSPRFSILCQTLGYLATLKWASRLHLFTSSQSNVYEKCFASACYKLFDLQNSADESLMGWEAVFQDHSSGGRWAPDEASQRINCLELKAVYLGLQSFCQNLSQAHMRIFIDSTTAVAYINNMGGTHPLERNHIARRFGCGVLNAIFVFLLHICLDRKSNSAADKLKLLEFFMIAQNGSWTLTFTSHFTQVFVVPSIDLFASRLNFQTKPYIAWHPNPGAFAIDAFSVSWGKHFFFYILIDRVLQKVEADEASGILIVPQ